jgi:rod shape determining protein RodA
MNLENLKRHMIRSDWWMTLSILALIAIGILFIYSAGFQSADTPVSAFYQRQILWAFVGLEGYVTLAVTDYRRVAEAAWWIYAVTLFLLVLVLLIGKPVYGATRWLSLFEIQVQPSEFAKLALVLVVARYLARPGRDIGQPRCVWLTLLMAVIPFTLIARQPDLGTAAALVPIAFLILFAAGVRVKFLAILVLLGMMSLPVAWLGLGDYQRDRILVFVDPGRDPYGAGWNKMQSEIAVGSGGLAGKGYLRGTQNVLGYLPRTVAPTDFIYSVIAEEKGFIGAATVLSLYGLVLMSGIRASLAARDKLGRLIAVGITGMIFFHVFVNIAMTIGLMPITGLPLPLMSYGGSFMISTMLGLGILQSIFIRRERR